MKRKVFNVYLPCVAVQYICRDNRKNNGFNITNFKGLTVGYTLPTSFNTQSNIYKSYVFQHLNKTVIDCLEFTTTVSI